MNMRTNRRRVRVEFGDCDPAEIVYYPKYFSWLDQSTHYLFESVGIVWRELPERWGIQAPLVDAHARFLSPAVWGDDLEIESRVERWGDRSFVIAHRVLNASSGECIVEATETRVCVKLNPSAPKKITAVTVPEAIKEAFQMA